MRALVLDFDGVISDSAAEAFEVALDTYVQMRPDSRLRDEDATRLYGRFLELVPLGNRAEDYGLALAALESGSAIPDQKAYDAFKAQWDPEWLRAYHKRFYGVRAAFAESEPKRWRALLRPYPEFLAVLRRHAGELSLAIATAKDRFSVRTLLREYGVEDLFPDGLVLDKETGVSKVAHVEHLRGVLDVDYSEMTFLDDKVNHLDAVAPLGVRCALAAWGYNGARERRLARERGYLVCGLEDVESALFGARA